MAQKPKPKTKRRRLGILLVAVTIILTLQIGLVVAAPPAFEEVLKPLETIYNLVKYAATVVAGLMMLFAGLTYIFLVAQILESERRRRTWSCMLSSV